MIKNKHILEVFFVLFIVFLNLTYYLYRPLVLALALSSLFLIVFPNLLVKKVSKDWMMYFKPILILSVILYLIYTFFQFRLISFDGLYVYFKNVLLLKDKFYISYSTLPPFPYLVEMLLAVVLKFGGLRLMNLMFGLSTVTAVFSTILLYKKLNLNKEITKLALVILISSPAFLSIALIDFKIEMFLLTLMNLAYVFFVDLVNTQKIKSYFLFGLFCGLALLVKILIIPLVVFMFGFLFFETLREKNIVGLVKISFAGGITSTILIVWSLAFGMGLGVPGRFKIDSIIPEVKISKPVLEKNTDKLNICIKDATKSDYGQFIYGSSPLEKAMQPFYYLLSKGRYLQFIIFVNPGIFIYLGFWLFPLIIFLFKDFRKNKAFLLLYLSTVLFSIVFYLAEFRTVYWYLFASYPFYSVSLPLIIERLISENKFRYVLKVCIYVFFIAHVVGGVCLAMLYANFQDKLDDKKSAIYNMNMIVDEVGDKGYILDASEHEHYVFYPFLKNADSRVINSTYYFVSSGKSMDDMYEELNSKNIKTIVVLRESLFNPWYKGCPLENNKIISKFLNEYAYPVYPMNSEPVVFSLK